MTQRQVLLNYVVADQSDGQVCDKRDRSASKRFLEHRFKLQLTGEPCRTLDDQHMPCYPDRIEINHGGDGSAQPVESLIVSIAKPFYQQEPCRNFPSIDKGADQHNADSAHYADVVGYNLTYKISKRIKKRTNEQAGQKCSSLCSRPIRSGNVLFIPG